MLKLDILNKMIILIYREGLLNISQEHSSSGLIRTIINNQINSNSFKRVLGGDTELIKTLIEFILSYLDGEALDHTTIIDNLTIIYRDNPSYLTSVKDVLSRDIKEDSLKKSVVTIRNQLQNIYREQEVKKILYNTLLKLNDTSENFKTTIDDMSNRINIFMERTNKEKGVIDNLDISDTDILTNVIDEIKDSDNGNNLLISGWEELNIALQGGFRKGDFVMVSALQHKYKSGFVQSLLVQLAMHNKPKLLDNTKKPLLVYISFEDSRAKYVEFIYNYIYYNEYRTLPNIRNIQKKDIVDYIKKNLTINGYQIKLLRVNPSEWTYKSLINKMIEFESQGYEIHACITDYLSKLPTTDIHANIPIGTTLRELFSLVRNYMSSRGILFITPHQLNTRSKALLGVNGMVDDLCFVKEITGMGYTEGSGQLDQVIDVEINIHIAKKHGQEVLTVNVGKHRHANVIDNKDKKFFMLPFPKKAPILKTLDAPENKYSELTDNDIPF